jgi:hypothetical protein
VSTNTVTNNIVAGFVAAMLPMVQVIKDTVSTDTIAAAGRRHALPKFDGTKKKWPDWHRAVK